MRCHVLQHLSRLTVIKQILGGIYQRFSMFNQPLNIYRRRLKQSGTKELELHPIIQRL